jgi:hypothetical protein
MEIEKKDGEGKKKMGMGVCKPGLYSYNLVDSGIVYGNDTWCHRLLSESRNATAKRHCHMLE